ncbi:DNA topoisomerase 1 [Nymphon striatum]|nr:DNA topoisomerase 1 [Nymphon striatum]
MAKNLVIVESPAKAKTIEKFLGKDFKVESSFGHIADLPSKELGVDVDNDFKPKYIVDDDKKALVKKLKDLAKKADVIWLASDEDREGEAISWHLEINYNLVNAQQARRVLDRLVGYQLSPVLWKKIKPGLSAGRVQSVAVRLIDSVNLSSEAITAAKDAIVSNYGDAYSNVRTFKGKSKGAQEAHEAIRPTDMMKQSPSLERDQSKLYELIWKRTIASQMSDAQLERTNVKVKANTHSEVFTANGEVIKFDGFLKVYLESQDEEDAGEEQEGMLPAMSVGDNLNNNFITATERFSRAPYRFTEASLVKKLEELGIGRPSTYAPTIGTIVNRKYVEKGTIEGNERNYIQLVLEADALNEKNLSEMVGSDKGKLVPTDIEGHEDFYKDFRPNVLDVEENADRASGERILGKHPKSGKPVLVRLGRFGPMVQVGSADDEEKPTFASLLPDQSLGTITFEEAMELFKLPRKLGVYEGEEILANVGRFGPYVKFGEKFISMEKGESAMEIELDRAIELIVAKQKADAPIANYEGKDVQKGTGRFGPFIKWDGLFINVNKKYDFDNLTKADIEELIEVKKQKEIDKLIQEWPEEGIRIEKARWGRHNIIKGKIKVEIAKSVDATKVSLKEAMALIEKKTPKKKAKAKPKAKAKAKPKAKKK